MNICIFLKPKSTIVTINEKSTVRQALEIMENSGFTALPIISDEGKYIGTLSEGDLLWYFKSLGVFSIKDAVRVPLTSIKRRRNYYPIRVNEDMSNLLYMSKKENFIPVIDDRDMFIGIITRQDIIDYFYKSNNIGEKNEK